MDDAREESLDSAESLSREPGRFKSEESQNWVDHPCVSPQDSADGNSYDSWEDEAYYNVCPNVDDGTDETLEENNNDPNNNMDSIEASRDPGQDDGAAEVEIAGSVDRAGSPKPGCSRDSWPFSPIERIGDDADDEAIDERTEHILNLLAKINRDSVLEGLKRNKEMDLSELKLWDLIPENERIAYSSDEARNRTVAHRAEYQESAEYGTQNTASVALAGTNSVKRRPAEDICTVGCKKSSSDSKIVASLSKTVETVLPVGTIKMATMSQIPVAATPSAMTSTVSQRSYKMPPADIRHHDAALYYQRFGFVPNRTGATASGHNQSANVGSGAIPLAKNNSREAILKKQSRRNAIIIAQVAHRGNGTILKVAGNEGRTVHGNAINQMQQQQHQQHQQQTTVIGQTADNIVSRGAIPKVVAIDRPRNLHGVTAAAPLSHESWSNGNRPVSANPQKRMEQRAQTVLHRSATQSALDEITVDLRHKMTTANETRAHRPGDKPIANRMEEGMESKERQQPQQDNDRVICMDIYYKVRNIFPNVDPNYIKSLCPSDWGPGDRDAQLSSIVEYILERGDTVPMLPETTPENGAGAIEIAGSCGDADDIYETLLGIFPDADPHYLRDFAEKNVARPNAVKEFVDSKFETRNYPTRDQYLARLKITEQQKQYTTGFNVKQFLTIIPDPFKYFLDPSRKCRHSTVAFEFLKSYFNKIRVSQISKTYREFRENLSLTSAALESMNPEMKSKRARPEMPTEDILLLQEIAFVKHKAEISEYMENIRRAEEEEFKRLKNQNQLLECQCCFDSECVPSKCSSCDNGHIFCNACVITGTSTKMGEDQTRISCFVNCGSEFSLSVLQRVLAPTTFSILLKKRQAAEVIEAGLDGLVSCPFCHFASIPPEGDKVFKCLNPECTKESCRLCKELSHVPLKCDEVTKADKARLYIEEKMTEALARKCYQCHRSFFKEEGCNKINCPCGATMCYLCDQPIKDYKHFRGQGSNDKNLCPLYTDTIRLDAVAVRKVAEQAEKEILMLDPSVKINTAKLLPNIPLPTRGPHTDILNADELPRRAHRVLENQPQL